MGSGSLILLDTHVLLWWVSGMSGQLSPAAVRAIEAEQTDGEILVSAISAWEIALLVKRGRVALARDVAQWLELVGRIDRVRFVPVDVDVAVQSVELPGELHADPADRILVATSRALRAPLLTADERLRNYPHLSVIW